MDTLQLTLLFLHFLGLQRYSGLIELRNNRNVLWEEKIEEFYSCTYNLTELTFVNDHSVANFVNDHRIFYKLFRNSPKTAGVSVQK